MINFSVDKTKCIKCGMCSLDCPKSIIDSKTEYPTIIEGTADNCIKCQHCLAICPTGALSICNKNPDDSILVSEPLPTYKNMTNLIKTRRSIRSFTKEVIDVKLIHQLISTASYAPTGRNDNSVKFLVIDDMKTMESFIELAYNSIRKALNEDKVPESYKFFETMLTLWENRNIDVIFRKGPYLLITSAPENSALPEEDCCIATSYFELLANTHDIGTLWDGFAKYLLNSVSPELKKRLGVPENHQVHTAMVFGKSAIKYKRSIQNDADIVQISL